jgi:tyrosyl-tRNA synthetase
VDIIDAQALEQKLEKAAKSNTPLKVKLGLDPSSPDIHLGHTVVLNKLRVFQNHGHQALFVIGDFTARIGDPSGRNKLRPPLSPEEIAENAKTYTDQAFKILDPQKTQIVYNHEWLSRLSVPEIIRLCARTSVAQLLEREDFTKRYKANTPIFLHEFLYPLFQGYDSVHLKNDVELGGTDQKFNLLMGRTLQKEHGLPPQDILTMPILEGLDGIQKMSKSLKNTIALNERPEDMYGKLMSISDALMPKYFTLLSFLSPDAIQKLLAGHPMKAKAALALEITERFHGKTLAMKAEEHFRHVHQAGHLPETLMEVKITEASLPLAKLIWVLNLVPSMKESRRKIQEGAVSVDGTRITDPNQQIEIPKDGCVVRLGKRHFRRVLA